MRSGRSTVRSAGHRCAEPLLGRRGRTRAEGARPRHARELQGLPELDVDSLHDHHEVHLWEQDVLTLSGAVADIHVPLAFQFQQLLQLGTPGGLRVGRGPITTENIVTEGDSLLD